LGRTDGAAQHLWLADRHKKAKHEGQTQRGILMDTVLWGGFLFLIAVGGMFLAMGRIDRSDLPDRKKRLLNYALMAGITALAFLIFRWHSASWMAAHM
jgi:hypothetical protein